MGLLNFWGKKAPSAAKSSFEIVAPPKPAFVDPYQQYIDACQPHPKDPTVLITRDPENLKAVHSPNIAMVMLLREVDPKLVEEVQKLEVRPDLHDISQQYRHGPPVDMPHVREDLRKIALLRSELSGDGLMKPILVAGVRPPLTDAPPSTFLDDHGFHSDRSAVGLRLHTTYAGSTIQGLSLPSIDRLKNDGLTVNNIFRDEEEILVKNIKAEDIIDDVPLYAIVAFKGAGYQDPTPNPSAPPHILWQHRGPDRSVENGIAAIHGLDYNTPEVMSYRKNGPIPEAHI